MEAERSGQLTKLYKRAIRASRGIDVGISRFVLFASGSTLFQSLCLSFVFYAVLLAIVLQIPMRPQKRGFSYITISANIGPVIDEAVREDTRTASSPPATSPTIAEGKEETITPEQEQGTKFVKDGIETSAKKEHDKVPYQSSGKDTIFSPGEKQRTNTLAEFRVPKKTVRQEKAPRLEPLEEEVVETEELVSAETTQEQVEEDLTISEEGPVPGEEVPVEIDPQYLIDTPPAVTSMGPLEFPKSFRTKIVRTETIIRVILDAEGRRVGFEILKSGGRDFDEAAILSLLQTAFSPARVGQTAVPCVVDLTYLFVASEDSEDTGER